MKKKDKSEKIWRRLDNSAKIFPIMSSKKYSSVFRISAVLKEPIKMEILKKAVNQALETFYYFKVCLKPGFFWYYFENNHRDPVIEEEHQYPCKYIDPNTNHRYLFKVTYFKNKINLDIFHSLTDGNSGTHFLKEIVYCYLELAHPEKFTEKIRSSRKIYFNVEDDYMKNYDRRLNKREKSRKAYLLQGKKLPFEAIAAVHEMIDLAQLKDKAKEKEVTVTQFLTAVLISSIYEANQKKGNSKRPIKICIPVDLKKYFKSETINNFFTYITVEANMMQKEMSDFNFILNFVKQDFEKRLVGDEIKKTMSANVKLGNNVFIRLIPLFLKNVVVKLGYIEIRKYTTTTFSNVGRVGIIADYKEYIENFMILIAPEPVEKIKCSSCSYENTLVFTFTSSLQEQGIETVFYKKLQELGIQVKIESNGVREDVIS